MTPTDERAETLAYHAERLAEFDAALYPNGMPSSHAPAPKAAANQSHGTALWAEPASKVHRAGNAWLDVWTECAFTVSAR